MAVLVTYGYLHLLNKPQTKSIMKNKLITTTVTLVLFLPLLVSAARVYEPLVGIPGVNPATDFESYINSLYTLSISIAALLAVIKIVIAGVKWMLTDVVPSKSEAKKDIQGALIGLLIVLAAVLVLKIINPNLVNVELSLEKLQNPSSGASGTQQNTPFQNVGPLDRIESVNDGQRGGCPGFPYLNPSDAQLRDICENEKPNLCPSTAGILSANCPTSACYKGTYSDGKCLITASDYQQESFPCEQTGKIPDDYGNLPYDCSAAETNCINSSAVSTKEDGSQVLCCYDLFDTKCD